MDFGFGEDQELLRTTTRRFLDRASVTGRGQALVGGGRAVRRGVWRQGAELGWTAMLVPVEYEGGSVTEQPLVDLVVLAEELGRALNPGPFVPSNVVADAITRFGTEMQSKEHLPRLARGESTCAWCLSGDGSPDPSAIEVRATRVGEGWHLSGVARYVHAAGDADAAPRDGEGHGRRRHREPLGPATGGGPLRARALRPRPDPAVRRGPIRRRLGARCGGAPGRVVRGRTLPVGRHGAAGGRVRRAPPTLSSSRPWSTPRSASNSAGPSGASRPSSTAWPTY